MTGYSTTALFLLLLAAGLPVLPAGPPPNLVKNGGFEAGMSDAWRIASAGGGTPWWNNGGCQSKAEADEANPQSGLLALHLVNRSARQPHVYGMTAQRVPISKNQLYRITLWAKGNRLASAGAVNLCVDPEWKIRPIQLPAGSFSWKKFEGTFSLPADAMDLRIIMEDQGEAWLDQISVEALDGRFTEPSPQQSASALAAKVATLVENAMTEAKPGYRRWTFDLVMTEQNGVGVDFTEYEVWMTSPIKEANLHRKKSHAWRLEPRQRKRIADYMTVRGNAPDYTESSLHASLRIVYRGVDDNGHTTAVEFRVER